MPESVFDAPIVKQVGEQFAGQRLDAALAIMFPQYSRSRLQQWIRNGYVLLDGVAVKPRTRLVGDEVLQQTGKLLNQSFREGDLVARFGGEEFVVLLNHCDAAFAQDKAESLRQEIEALKPNDISVTTSIGLTTLESGSEADFEAMFSTADKGVYEAKEAGRNRVVFKPLGG